MRAKELRQKYLDFFISKKHKVIPSASVVPDDESTLFTTAGMQSLVPYLKGKPHPEGNRLVNCQKCLRTDDIDEVGDAVHHSFFEMLGNWSLGDYFKDRSIKLSYEFLTQILKLDPKRLYVTCFNGDKDAPKDQTSAEIWKSIGIPSERIYFYGKKENWWGPAGTTGPCGPDTEIHYDVTQKACGPNCRPGCPCGRFSEIWNNVFMEYNKTINGNFEPLKQKNVDTGMGLERILAIVNGYEDNFLTDLWQPAIKKLEMVTHRQYQNNKREFRIIADHIRAIIFIISAQIKPSNKKHGYILRRLIRRVVVQLRQLGVTNFSDITNKISLVFINKMSDRYPELKNNKSMIQKVTKVEIEKFEKTLNLGIKKLNKLSNVDGEIAFNLFQTYGIPFEITQEILAKKGIKIDKKAFVKAMVSHQKKSRTASSGMFKSGLISHSKIAIKYHTATHLLHQALRDILGDHVHQAGSNITNERLRFDFTHDKSLSEKELVKVEEIINQKINAGLLVKKEEMPYQEAIKSGALAFFKQKYPKQVIVYSIGDYSKELCAGPHVKNTSEIGKIKVDKQKSLGQGLRRIYLKLI